MNAPRFGMVLFVAAAAAVASAQVPRPGPPGRRLPGPFFPQATPTPRPSPAAAPSPRPRLLWRTFLRRCDATAAVSGRTSFVAANSFLFQLDSSGRIVWTTEIGATQATPALDNFSVYVGSERGVLFAIDRKSGSPRWRFTAGNAIRCAPAVGADRVFVESLDNNLYALDAANGAVKWKFERPDGSLGYAAPVLAGEAALYACGDLSVYRLDPLSGKPVWRAVVGGKSVSSVAVAAGRVYVGGDGAGLTALAEEDGRRLWRFAGLASGPGNDWFGPPLVAGNTVYVSTYRRFVYALDAASGRLRWACRLPGAALATPALDAKRSTLYVTSGTFKNNPTLTAIHARTGVKQWEYPMGYVVASPLLSADRLYVGSTTGYYHAFALD